MNSTERRKQRYLRRKEKRINKRKEVVKNIGTAEDVFQFHDMFNYGKDCCKGVRWKQSVNNFERHLFSRTAVNRARALSDNYKPKKLSCFTIHERGKVREIEAPHIDDRQIQKTLTKKVLLPLYKDRLIYDNGASLKGKGLKFSQEIFDKAIRKHIKQYGMTGWVIIADDKKFFPNADRTIVKEKHKEIEDIRLRRILDTVVDIGKGDKGLPIGVEPSQIEMVSLPSPIDSYMSCQMGLKGFGHYMDDYHILVPPDKNPKEILNIFIEKSKEYNIEVNINKTHIVPFGKAFKFCKRKREIKNGKIFVTGNRDSRKRARRKIKMFARSTLSWEDVYCSVNSMVAYMDMSSGHNAVIKLKRLFYGIFGFPCDKVEEFRKRDQNGVCMPQAV